MTTTLWRYAHLALAVCSFIFLLIASVTGVFLGIDAIQERSLPYKAENFDQLTIAQTLPVLKEKYSEIFEISVDHNGFVSLEGFDNEGNDVKSIIDPRTGEILAEPIVKSDFYQWNLALHRSLFLKEKGRFVVGVISFLLMLIAVSGTILIIKRQQGIKKFFSKIQKDFPAQYYHVFASRLLLIPIFVIALTGTYLFLLRFEVLSTPQVETQKLLTLEAVDEEKNIEWKDFPIFNKIHLLDVSKIEFPFAEDPEEFFIIKTKEKELSVHQFSGDVLSVTNYTSQHFWELWSVDLHTGRTNIIWAIILVIASFNIIFFIITGFRMTFKRIKVKIPKNKYSIRDAEYIILLGSENRTTIGFAKNIHLQILAAGKKSFIAELNEYTIYPKAKQILIFTSTYGSGEAPYNARNFEKLLYQFPQKQGVEYSIVGFGSTAYEKFCGYAYEVQNWISALDWSEENLPLYTVNDKSPEEFVHWVKAWGEKNMIPLATAPALYHQEISNLIKMKVVESARMPKGELVFQMQIQPKKNIKFQSGDLLAIYPAQDHRERFYSISGQKNKIQLVVKLHEFGLGSQYLYQLKKGDLIQARIIQNDHFHFPKNAGKVALIANGTGVAPFLGMVENNISKVPVRLYCGFRYRDQTSQIYQKFADVQLQKGQLKDFQIGFSREEDPKYVMDLIRQDAEYFADLLSNNGVIMICGSLKMLRDVEKVLEELCIEKLGTSFANFKANGQVLTDCY